MGAGTVRSSSTILAASHGSRPRLTATKRDASQQCWALAVCPCRQNRPIRPQSGHGDPSGTRRSGRAGRLTAGLRGLRKKFSPSNSTPAYTLVVLNRRSGHVKFFTFSPDLVPAASLAFPCLGLCHATAPALSSRRSRHVSKFVQMDQGLTPAKFGCAAPPAKGRTHVAGHSL